MLGAVWCGVLVLILAWILIITIVFALLLWDAHNGLHDLEDEIVNKFDAPLSDIEDNKICFDNVTDSLEGFRPCIDEYCDPANFPRLLDAVVCKGCWNANFNSPMLSSGVGTNGDVYYVCTPGTTFLDGNDEWGIGDALKFIDETPTGPRWIKNDGSPSPDPEPKPTIGGNGTTAVDLGASFEVTADVSMQNIGAGSASPLANPGSDSAFDFKSYIGERGVEVTQTLDQITWKGKITLRENAVTTNFPPDSFFDSMDGTDDTDLNELIYTISSMLCQAGERGISCHCRTTRTSGVVLMLVQNELDTAGTRRCRCVWVVTYVKDFDSSGSESFTVRNQIACLS